MYHWRREGRYPFSLRFLELVLPLVFFARDIDKEALSFIIGGEKLFTTLQAVLTIVVYLFFLHEIGWITAIYLNSMYMGIGNGFGTFLSVNSVGCNISCCGNPRESFFLAMCVHPPLDDPPPPPRPPLHEKVWQLRCDVHILDHGGNLIDACTLATMAALRHFRRPGVPAKSVIGRDRGEVSPCAYMPVVASDVVDTLQEVRV